MKGYEETFWSDENILWFDCGGGSVTVYVCQIHKTIHLKGMNFTVCKLHFNKKYKHQEQVLTGHSKGFIVNALVLPIVLSHSCGLQPGTPGGTEILLVTHGQVDRLAKLSLVKG